MFYYNYIPLPYEVEAMAKLIGEPVKINRKNYSVASFVWRKRLYKVEEVISWWREPTAWWRGEKIRLFVRVIAKNSSVGVYELFKLDEEWVLHRVLD